MNHTLTEKRLTGAAFAWAFASLCLAAGSSATGAEPAGLSLSDEVIPFDQLGENSVERPKLVMESIEHGFFAGNRERARRIRERNETGVDMEIGEYRSLTGSDRFLSPGTIGAGFATPTGAVLQPQLVVFGDYRSGLQTFDNGVTNVTEWANRLDLHANLFITPTERILLGFRPLDRKGEFSGYRFSGNQGEGSESHFNGNIQTLFFEGDLGEMLPILDPDDSRSLDYHLTIGRMPLSFQDGIMINDRMDAIGLTRSSLFWFGASAFRIAGVVGVNQIHRANNREDEDARLYGVFMSADYERATYDVDIAYVDGSDRTGGDGAYLGLGRTRRYGYFNSTLRANFSRALEEETDAVSTGTLLFSQISTTMPYNRDIAYLNGFWAIDDYASAARDPAVGGPLGQTGLLFDAVGLGEYGSALGNRANSAVGAALGYQHFLDERNRRQVVGEIGGRIGTADPERSAGAIGARYQQAVGQHLIFVLDGFGAVYDDGETGYGGRAELRVKF